MRKEISNPIAGLFKYLFISISFMILGYVSGMLWVPPSVIYLANNILCVMMVIMFILAIFSKNSKVPRRFSMNYVYIYTFITGMSMSIIISYYSAILGVGTILCVLLSTMLIIGILAYIASKDESGKFLNLGPILVIMTIVLLAMTLLQLFIAGDTGDVLVSGLGLIIFSGWVLYDISVIKKSIEYGEIRERDDLSIHVLNIYVDFINIFTDLLRLIAETRD